MSRARDILERTHPDIEKHLAKTVQRWQDSTGAPSARHRMEVYAKATKPGGELEKYHPGESDVYRGTEGPGKSHLKHGTSWSKDKAGVDAYKSNADLEEKPGFKVMKKHITKNDAALDVNKVHPHKYFADEKEVFLPKQSESRASLIIERDSMFIKRGQMLGNMTRDFKVAQKVTRDWKKGKMQRMSAIRDYHKSTEGKKFHRDLATYSSQRYFIPKEGMLGLGLHNRGMHD